MVVLEQEQMLYFPIGRKVSTGAAGDSEDQSVTGIIEGQGALIVGAGDL